LQLQAGYHPYHHKYFSRRVKLALQCSYPVGLTQQCNSMPWFTGRLIHRIKPVGKISSALPMLLRRRLPDWIQAVISMRYAYYSAWVPQSGGPISAAISTSEYMPFCNIHICA